MIADPEVAFAPPYPSPRLEPWQGFAMAADAAARYLNHQLGLDLWVVSHVHQDELTVVAAAGDWSQLMPPGTTLPWRETFCSRMVDQSGPTVAPDVRSLPAYAPLAKGVFGRVKAYVGVPLEGDNGELFGTLAAVSGTEQPVSLAESLTVVQLVGQMLSTIVAREQMARARSEDAATAYALAERDELTKLRNRRGWTSALVQEEIRCQRYGSTGSVLVLDLDDLKRTNDTGGHDAGDRLLVRCGAVMGQVSRPGDTLARIGGDEFGVLAVECDAVSLRAMLHRMRVQLRASGVSASVGAATRRPGEDLADTWKRADEAMYRDKRRRSSPGP